MEQAMGFGAGGSVALNNGVRMPWLGLGVWRMQEGDEVAGAVKAAVDAGYRSIDTASFYGNKEGVGRAVRGCGVPREEMFVTTKVWNTDQGYENTLRAFERSRKSLGLSYLDLYLVHWARPDTYRETWKALVHLYKEGFVRAIGVSNHQIRHLEAIMEDTGVVPAVNQVERHPLLTQQELLAFCGEQNIRMEAWRPLMKGRVDHPLIARFAEKYGKTQAQILLRWQVQGGVVVIPKSVHPERIAENAQIFDFELEEADMRAIDALNENRRFGEDPDTLFA